MRYRRAVNALLLGATLSLNGILMDKIAERSKPAISINTDQGEFERHFSITARPPVSNGLPINSSTDSEPSKRTLLIDKSDRRLTVFFDQEPIVSFPISLGYNPKGDKQVRGDFKTPEGSFYVVKHVPNSTFYKALYISYPNIEDAQRGLEHNLISPRQKKNIETAIDKCTMPPQRTKLGSYIEIHGHGGGQEYGDWTHGCIAVNNDIMDKLYEFAKAGCNESGKFRTEVIIRP
jgi:murein L,D-transpeptidase YafK